MSNAAMGNRDRMDRRRAWYGRQRSWPLKNWQGKTHEALSSHEVRIQYRIQYQSGRESDHHDGSKDK